MRKRLSALLLSVLMLVTMLPVTAFAADENVLSGTCGATENDNVTWTLTQNNEDNDNPTYTLTISGKGAMQGYGNGEQPTYTQPWQNFAAKITSVVIDDGVTSLGDFAFFNYSALTQVQFLSNSVTDIGNWTFAGCTAVTQIVLPNSIKNIGQQAFSYCTSLESVELPDGMESLENQTFINCWKLNNVVIPNSVRNLPDGLFVNCRSLTDCTLPANITKIPNQFFAGAVALQKFIVPDGVTEIGSAAFRGCENLKDVMIPESVTTIGHHVFSDGGVFNKETLTTKSLEKIVVLGENVGVDYEAFNSSATGLVVYVNGDLTEVSETTTPSYVNTHTMVYVNGGKVDLDKNGLVAVTRTNYTAKWYTDSQYQTEVTEFEKGAGKTYYAKWTEKLTQDAPAAPTLKDRTYTSVTLNEVADAENGAKAEYSKDGGKTWKTSPEFTNLTSGTTYTFAVRYAETDAYKASDIATADFATLRHSSSGSSSSSSTTTTNPVSASTASNGKVSLDKSTAKKGDTVTITVTPDSGYELGKLTVTDAKGNTIAVSKKSDTQYTFTMPDGKVTVTPTFTKVADENPSEITYTDVADKDWYADAVAYVTNKGLMGGTGDNKFSPNASTTRGMLMTVLARYAGQDTTNSTPWYQAGMDWAKANGVSDGTNPTVNITREQLVTMLYRYAGSPAANGSLDNFSDSASVSSYAVNAMQWAVENGIVNGSNGKLNPKNNATRAEVAAILMRYCEMGK